MEVDEPHSSVPPIHRWRGTVIDNPDGGSATDTAFCALLTQPRGFKFDHSVQPLLLVHSPKANLPSEQLWRVRLHAKHDKKAVLRELVGVSQLCDPEWQKDTMGPIRQALLSTPVNRPQNVKDLTLHAAKPWQAFQDYLKANKNFNPGQLRIINASEKVEDSFILVEGPPGTGKTDTIANTVIRGLVTGHKSLCTGASNTAVDELGMRVRRELNGVYKSGKAAGMSLDQEKIKVLRLEVSSTELATLATDSKRALDPVQTCECLCIPSRPWTARHVTHARTGRVGRHWTCKHSRRGHEEDKGDGRQVNSARSLHGCV